MKRITLMLAAAAALSLPAAALADDPAPVPADLAAASCKQQLKSMGATSFAELYGTNAKKTNAMGKCVAKAARAATADVQNAAKQCRAEQSGWDPAAHDGKSFEQAYGANTKAKGAGATKNALGKCVSQHAKAATAASTNAAVKAAKACKAQRKEDSAGFAQQWGSKRNAFGKCVSATSKTQNR